jgi:hypothetical protein
MSSEYHVIKSLVRIKPLHDKSEGLSRTNAFKEFREFGTGYSNHTFKFPDTSGTNKKRYQTLN